MLPKTRNFEIVSLISWTHSSACARAQDVFLPPPPHDFMGRTEAVEMPYTAPAENPGRALLHGEPGCGKSTLALKFA